MNEETSSYYVRAYMLSHFIRVQLFVDLWTVVLQAPLSVRFSRQEYWSGSPCLPPLVPPDPGVEPASPVSRALQVDSLPLSHQGSPLTTYECKAVADYEC